MAKNLEAAQPRTLLDPTTFIGTKADQIDKALLGRAQQRLQSGDDGEAIRKEAGWGFDDRTQRWRREISDRNMQILDNKIIQGGEHRLGDVISHPELEKHYPELADMKITFKEGQDIGGVFIPGENSLEITSTPGNKVMRHRILAHEIQHALNKLSAERGDINAPQGAGFGKTIYTKLGEEDRKGVKALTEDLKAELAMLKNDASAGTDSNVAQQAQLKRFLDEYEKILKSGIWPSDSSTAAYLGYRGQRGEAEGFGVAARSQFTPEELRAQPPTPFEAFDPEEPNQPIEQSRFRYITPDVQSVTNLQGRTNTVRGGVQVPQRSTLEALLGLFD